MKDEQFYKILRLLAVVFVAFLAISILCALVRTLCYFFLVGSAVDSLVVLVEGLLEGFPK